MRWIFSPFRLSLDKGARSGVRLRKELERIMKTITQEGTVRRVVSVRMPTRWGVFQTLGFEREISNRLETALAIVIGDPGDLTAEAPLVRVHSQCLTGEALGSLRC